MHRYFFRFISRESSVLGNVGESSAAIPLESATGAVGSSRELPYASCSLLFASGCLSKHRVEDLRRHFSHYFAA